MKNLVPIVILVCLSTALQAQTITTFAGTGISGFGGDGGMATAAILSKPSGIVADAVGNIYFSDQTNHRIRKIDPAGVITTVAGTGSTAFNGDNIAATNASLHLPIGLALDAAGNILVSDVGHHRIRKIDKTSGNISTIAGTGSMGYNGDNIPATAAQIYTPNHIAADASGNIYIADAQNYRIRRVDPSGMITTIAGNGMIDYAGDNGPATNANMKYASGIAVDHDGNVYFCDPWPSVIRRISTSGIITTVVGNGTQGYSGDGLLAKDAALHGPSGIWINNSNELFISDAGNSVIRKVNLATGIINTIVGNGTEGYSGDGGPSTAAQMTNPNGVWSEANIIYISDGNNFRIRRVSHQLAVSQHAEPRMKATIYPNPCRNTFQCTIIAALSAPVSIAILNTAGQLVKAQVVELNKPETIELNEPAGTYFIFANDQQRSFIGKVTVMK